MTDEELSSWANERVYDSLVKRGVIKFEKGLPCARCGNSDETGCFGTTPLGVLALRLHSIVKSLSA